MMEVKSVTEFMVENECADMQDILYSHWVFKRENKRNQILPMSCMRGKSILNKCFVLESVSARKTDIPYMLLQPKQCQFPLYFGIR